MAAGAITDDVVAVAAETARIAVQRITAGNQPTWGLVASVTPFKVTLWTGAAAVPAQPNRDVTFVVGDRVTILPVGGHLVATCRF